MKIYSLLFFVIFNCTIVAMSQTKGLSSEDGLTSARFVQFLTSERTIERKLAVIELFMKLKAKLDHEDISFLFKHFRSCKTEELNKILPALSSCLSKTENFKEVLKNYPFLLQIRSRNAKPEEKAFLVEYLYELSSLNGDGHVYKKVMEICSSQYKGSDLEHLVFLTLITKVHLDMEIINYLAANKKKMHLFNYLNKVWDIYLGSGNKQAVKLFFVTLNSKGINSNLYFYFTKELIDKLLSFAENSNSDMKELVAAYLVLYEIPTPYTKTVKWWNEHKKTFSTTDYLFHLALNDTVTKGDSDQFISHLCVFEIMLEHEYPGLTDYLKQQLDNLEKIYFDKSKDDYIRINAFFLVEDYFIALNRKTPPDLYYKAMEHFDGFSQFMKKYFIISLMSSDFSIGLDFKSFLQKIVLKKSYSFNLRFFALRCLVNNRLLSSNEMKNISKSLIEQSEAQKKRNEIQQGILQLLSVLYQKEYNNISECKKDVNAISVESKQIEDRTPSDVSP